MHHTCERIELEEPRGNQKTNKTKKHTFPLVPQIIWAFRQLQNGLGQDGVCTRSMESDASVCLVVCHAVSVHHI